MNLDSAVIYTKNLANSVKFYQEVVGLEVLHLEEGKFASLKFDNEVNLSIKQQTEDRESPGCQTIIIQSPDIEADYARVEAAQPKFYKQLTTEAWGQEFSVQDPDGNKVAFVQRS